jgi:glycosyltransferase involved in cell wall biosynthesis
VELRLAQYAVSVPQIRRTRLEDDSRFRLLVLGYKTASKGQMDALLALAILAAAGHDVELWLVGGGEAEYEHALSEAASQHGVASLITSLDFDPDAFAQVCNADVLLMCSRAEAFGRVTVEAMKAGKPVIGAATGATPELIRHGWNGFLYRQGDAQDLARWAEVLYEDRATAREMGQRGQRWAMETFSTEEYGSRLEAGLMTALKTSSAPRA